MLWDQGGVVDMAGISHSDHFQTTGMSPGWYLFVAHGNNLVYCRGGLEEPIVIQTINDDGSMGASRKVEIYDSAKPQVRNIKWRCSLCDSENYQFYT